MGWKIWKLALALNLLKTIEHSSTAMAEKNSQFNFISVLDKSHDTLK